MSIRRVEETQTQHAQTTGVEGCGVGVMVWFGQYTEITFLVSLFGGIAIPSQYISQNTVGRPVSQSNRFTT